MTNVSEPLFIRVSEASKILSIPVSTLYREAKRGSIPSRRIGTVVVIPAWFVKEGGEPNGSHPTSTRKR